MTDTRELLQVELAHYRSALRMPSDGAGADLVRLLEVLHRHLFEHTLTATRAFQLAGVPGGTIPTRFKQALGLDMRRYVHLLRVSAAQRLLRHANDFDVRDIAEAVGFTSPEGFARVFERHVGQTPLRYRTLSRRSG